MNQYTAFTDILETCNTFAMFIGYGLIVFFTFSVVRALYQSKRVSDFFFDVEGGFDSQPVVYVNRRNAPVPVRLRFLWLQSLSVSDHRMAIFEEACEILGIDPHIDTTERSLVEDCYLNAGTGMTPKELMCALEMDDVVDDGADSTKNF